MARAASHCSSEDVARAFRFPGLRSAGACEHAANGLGGFTRRYSRLLRKSLQLDARPAAFDTFRIEMGKIPTLSRSIARAAVSPCPARSVGLGRLPASLARGGRLGRFSTSRRVVPDAVPRRSAPMVTREPMSPRATLTVSTSGSSFSGSDRLSQHTDSPLARRVVPAPRFQVSDHDPPGHIAPFFNPSVMVDAPLGNELDTDHPEEVYASASPPMGSARNTCSIRNCRIRCGAYPPTSPKATTTAPPAQIGRFEGTHRSPYYRRSNATSKIRS